MSSSLSSLDHEPPHVARPTREGAWHRRLAYLFPIVSTLLVLVAVVAIGGNLWQSRVLAEQETERHLHSIAHALSQQTARTLHAVDLTLIAVADALNHRGIDWQNPGDPRVRQVMAEKASRTPYLRTLMLIDGQGRVVHLLNKRPSDPIVISDRPYFTVHRDGAHHGLYVGAPVISRAFGDWIMPISRRVEAPDGRFLGVITAVIEPDVLHAVYRQMELAPDAAVALFRNDGTLVVRYPDIPQQIGKSFAGYGILEKKTHHASLHALSPLDGVRRIYMKEEVPDSPLIVLIGFSEEGMLAAWRKNMMVYGLVAPILLGTCGALSFLLFRYMTRREAILRALQQSEERFRDFAEAAAERFWETDEFHRFTWHSGRDQSRFVGRTRWEKDGIDRVSDDPWRTHKRELDARRAFRDFQYERQSPSGTRYRTVSGVPVYDKDGRFKGYRGTYTDITAQVHTRHQATIHRDRFLRAIENLAEGFALYDADDRLVVCNTRYQELHRPLADALAPGTPFETFLRAALEIGFITEACGREAEWLAARLADHRMPPHVFEVMRGGRWYQIREQSDKDGGTLFFVLDIHDQKTIELQNQALTERVRLQFERMPAACLILSPAFTIVDWNPAAERMFGFTRQEMLGASPYDRLVPEHSKPLVRAIERRLRMSENEVAGPGESLTKSGELITCEWFNTVMSDATGKCIGFLCMAVDITEKRKAEEKLRQAQRMEAVGQLTGGIAHDFNNMLQVILGNSEILIQNLVDVPHLARWAETTKTAAERGANLTQRLLAFSRQQVLAPTAVDLPALIEDFVELLKPTLGENIEIVSQIEQPIAPLMLDVGQFENALLNLALNARDAMPQGGRLTIAARNAVLHEGMAEADVKPGNYVAVCVTDTGSGMEPAVLRRAIEPYFTTKEVNKGSGLGLSMAYGFVQQSGGHLKIESAVYRGTTVTLWFPRAAIMTAAEPAPADTAQPLPTGSETIMVVEDDEMVRSYVVNQLRSLGYALEEADTGGAALSKLTSRGPVDLLFTDIVMPGGMSGRELADEVTRRYPGTKILFTSGYTEKSESGSDPVPFGGPLLTKPYFRQDLAHRVREILDALVDPAS